MTNLPWTSEYRPKKLSQVQGHKKAMNQLKTYVLNFKKQKKKAVLLYGQTGSGKTCIAHALANDMNLEILEVNASDLRNKKGIKSVVGSASKQRSLFSKSKLILVDEIDGLSGRHDRGGVRELIRVIKNTSFPLILTANDIYDSKFSTLRKKCEKVQLRTPSYISIKSVLKKITKKEKLTVDDKTLKTIARRAGGDYRAAINDLQSIAQVSIDKNLKNIDDRNQTDSIFDALLRIFKSTDIDVAISALDNIDEDFDKSFMWIDENLPKEYTKPAELYKAYDALSLADVFKGRIRRWQYWRFMVYQKTLMTAGVALAKKEKYKKYTKYKPSSRIFKLWRMSQTRKKRKAIAKKIGEKMHESSTDIIQHSLPYIVNMMKKDKKLKSNMSKYFELDKSEVSWLLKQ
ncbi:MAG: Replication factor C large subunit [Candidatus Woesearchaeota archaeon]|nr:Replication factor C large subunit [Candidatus Woesearchaeota archaeon]